MRQRSELIVKAVCLIAGAVLLYQLGHLVFRGDPLKNVKIPQLPTLTNAPSGTNPPIAVATSSANITNKAGSKSLAQSGGFTNSPGPATNVVASVQSNTSLSAQSAVGTNLMATSSNAAAPPARSESKASTAVSGPAGATNSPGDSNRVVSVSSNTVPRTTNPQAIVSKSPPPGPQALPPGARALPGGMVMGRPGMGPGGPGGPRGPAPPLSKEIQARVDRITDSELLAPVMHPLPMGLLGIAGEHVFLRSPSGQTGLVKVGDSLGQIKLLKIGINRVLVEEDGQEKELTIFSGMGGESLMSAAKTNRLTVQGGGGGDSPPSLAANPSETGTNRPLSQPEQSPKR